MPREDWTAADWKGDTARGARYLSGRTAKFIMASLKRRDRMAEDYEFSRRAYESRKNKEDKGKFTLPEGDTKFRILMTPADEERGTPAVYMEYLQHYKIGKNQRSLRCGKNFLDDSGRCWLCNMRRKLQDEGRTQLAATLEPQLMFITQIALWDEDMGPRGPLRWPVSSGKSAKSLSYKLLKIIQDHPKKKYLSHKNGFWFTINRVGTGMTDTVYGAPERDDEPSAVPPEIIAKLKPFADVLLPYDEEAQKKAYYGRDDEEEEAVEPRRRREYAEEPMDGKRKFRDEESDVVEKKKRYVEEDEEAPAPKKRQAIEEDEEEEPQPKKRKFVEIDEDEAPAPKKRKFVDEDEDEAPRPKRRAVVEEDEDEPPVRKKKSFEEDEDDSDLNFGDEEEAPRPKRRAVAEEDEDADEPPVRKRRVEPEDEDEAPVRKKRVVVDEDEEEAPRPKRRAVEEDEDEEPAPKKRRVVEEDEEAPAPKKRKFVEVEDEDEEPAPKKRR